MGGVQRSPFAAPAAQFQPAAPEAPPQPPQRKHGGGHPPTSPQTAAKVLAVLDAGGSVSAACRAGGVSHVAVRGIWERDGRTWPPPGLGRRERGGGPSPALTPAQVRKVIRLRGQKQDNGRWERSIRSIAAEMGVKRGVVYRALERAGKGKTGTGEERP